MIRTILFDLDGTLLPMDQEEFIKTYFYKLTKRMEKEGFESEALTQMVWSGTKAMMMNNGEKTNREVFFEVFAAESGQDSTVYEPIFDRFYKEEFDTVKSILGENFGQREMIEELRAKGYRIILATAPVFPLAAVETRLGWIDLELKDFDDVTSYETSTYCKPNPQYYGEIFERNQCQPEECLMIGNNAREDAAAAKLGAEIYLVTNYLETTERENLSTFSHGDQDELKEFLRKMPKIN